MKKFMLALAAVSMLAGAAPSLAAPCKDAKGKFIKCPPPKPVQCKDAKGKFTKCPAAKPVQCRNAKGHFAKCK